MIRIKSKVSTKYFIGGIFMNKDINCLGDFCPIPSIKTQMAYKNLDIGNKIVLTTDHSCAPSNIKDALENDNCNIHVKEVVSGIWEITIKKLG